MVHSIQAAASYVRQTGVKTVELSSQKIYKHRLDRTTMDCVIGWLVVPLIQFLVWANIRLSEKEESNYRREKKNEKPPPAPTAQ